MTSEDMVRAFLVGGPHDGKSARVKLGLRTFRVPILRDIVSLSEDFVSADKGQPSIEYHEYRCDTGMVDAGADGGLNAIYKYAC